MKKWNDKTKVACSIVGLSLRVFYSKKGEISFYITVWK
ncbi:transcriptional regulator [Bacillus thuringiensis]|nr:transcriptional regulator [Bacillus tropicus]OTX80638.1 transcriptional regulator [Bacillus thuringiensis serovar chanpaisis]PFR09052.1 transcriptional regulator [Bacillus anthracis]PGZ35369.1 transcriptional regulator [Bacillus anthracis]PNK24507.1 transcriptional regulator [Bacillus thuringiensis]